MTYTCENVLKYLPLVGRLSLGPPSSGLSSNVHLLSVKSSHVRVYFSAVLWVNHRKTHLVRFICQEMQSLVKMISVSEGRSVHLHCDRVSAAHEEEDRQGPPFCEMWIKPRSSLLVYSSIHKSSHQAAYIYVWTISEAFYNMDLCLILLWVFSHCCLIIHKD